MEQRAYIDIICVKGVGGCSRLRGGMATKGLLSQLVKVCDNDINNAASELRWMMDHILKRRGKSFFKRLQPPSTKVRPLLSLLNSEMYQSNHTLVEDFTKKLEPKEMRKLEYFVSQRLRHKPLQYVLGTQPFYDKDIAVRPPVLIPRWETEEWTRKVIDIIQRTQNGQRIRIIELCSGSGCISIALALSLSDAVVVGCDISKFALLLSRFNKRKLAPFTNCQFIYADILQDSDIEKILKLSTSIDGDPSQGFDLVVSNPPYVKPTEYATLDPSVKYWEDERALITSDDDGLQFYKRILKISPKLLRKSNNSFPSIAFEIGSSQSNDVVALMNHNFDKIKTWKDLAGNDRTVIGYSKPHIEAVNVNGTSNVHHFADISVPDPSLKADVHPLLPKLPVKPEPLGPEDCCMSGCRVCVWDSYQEVT
jgi:release factor glutamine methyltransferase